MSGILYVVATPIGNLGDMTQRAIEVLKTVTMIAAEDTRHSRTLLQHFAIQTPLVSLHEYNEQQRAEHIVQQLLAGKTVALISDAGTPLINDPGYRLITAAHEAGIRVVSIPGACAAIAALSVAGLPTDQFLFAGFLPAKSAARRQKIAELQHFTMTLIVYEAPHRIVDTLKDAQELLGDRSAVVARELTKTHETIHGGKLSELVTYFQQHEDKCRGEMVLLIAGAPEVVAEDQSAATEILRILLAEVPLKEAVRLTHKITGLSRNELYEQALQMK